MRSVFTDHNFRPDSTAEVEKPMDLLPREHLAKSRVRIQAVQDLFTKKNHYQGFGWSFVVRVLK
jgi:hypothetical protein